MKEEREMQATKYLLSSSRALAPETVKIVFNIVFVSQ